MAKITYDKMSELIEKQAPFISNSVIAFNRGNYYIVRSYETDILKVDTKTGDVIFNYTNYSPTTRKIQNIIIGILARMGEFNFRILVGAKMRIRL